ncbi:MAG: hypothetical protein WC627_10905 [Legionella sp.]|jgi:hypothetical protein
MNRFSKIGLCLLLILAQSTWAYTQIDTNNYWQCSSYDSENKTWSASNTYQKISLTNALESCKKASTLPASCRADEGMCIEFNKEKNTKPRWQCVALDEQGDSYHSTYFADRDSAGLDAINTCKTNSKIPDTCSINLITCSINLDGVIPQ